MVDDKWQAKKAEYNTAFWTWVIVAHIAIIVIALMLGKIDLFVVKIPTILLVIPALAWYDIASLGKITTPDIGAKLLLGKPIQHLDSGLYYAPLGLCTVTRVLGLDFQVEIASDRRVEASNLDTATAQRVDEDILLIQGHTRDFRVVFGSGAGFKEGDEKMENWLEYDPKNPIQTEQANDLWKKVIITSKSKTDPLNVMEGQTWDPRVVFRGNVANTVEFIPRIGTIEAAATQLEDVVIAQLQSLTPRMTPAIYLLLLSHLEAKIKNALEWTIGEEGAKRPESEKGSAAELSQAGDQNPNHSWGINLLSVSIKGPGVQQRVSVAQANATAEQVAIQGAAARAEQDRLLLIAKAAGEAARITAQGEAFRKSSQDSGLSPQAILAAEVVRAMAAGDNKIIVGLPAALKEATELVTTVQPPAPALPPPSNNP